MTDNKTVCAAMHEIPTFVLTVAVLLPCQQKEGDCHHHGDQWDEVAPSKANVLLHCCHAHIGNQRPRIDKPVEPIKQAFIGSLVNSFSQ